MTSRSAYHVEPWPAPGAWADQAACKDADPDLFHPTPGNAYTRRAAVAVCDRCPVRGDCLAYVLANERDWSRDGIWGGLTATQRRELYRRAPR